MAQEKSLGSKILGLFIKDVEPTTGVNVPASPPTVPPHAPAAAPYIPPTPPPVTKEVGAIDTKFANHFASVLSEQNISGADYFEFMQILKNLQGVGLTDDKLYQATWASFKAVNSTLDANILVSSANQYLSVLEHDRSNFLKDVEYAIQERVGSLKTEMNTLGEQTKSIQQQIVELQAKIEQNNTRIGELAKEVEQQGAKINENKRNYEYTYASFVEQIKNDVENIRRYVR